MISVFDMSRYFNVELHNQLSCFQKTINLKKWICNAFLKRGKRVKSTTKSGRNTKYLVLQSRFSLKTPCMTQFGVEIELTRQIQYHGEPIRQVANGEDDQVPDHCLIHLLLLLILSCHAGPARRVCRCPVMWDRGLGRWAKSHVRSWSSLIPVI